MATAAYQKGQAQRTKARAGEIGGTETEGLSLGETRLGQFREVVAVNSSQSWDLELRKKVTGQSDMHGFVNMAKLSTTLPSRSIFQKLLEVPRALFHIFMATFGM